MYSNTSPLYSSIVRKFEEEAERFSHQADQLTAANLREAAVRMRSRAERAQMKLSRLQSSQTVRVIDLHTDPYFLYVAPFKGHQLCVAEAAARMSGGNIVGRMIVFVEHLPRRDDRLPQSQPLTECGVADAVDHLFDRLNDESDIVADWLGIEHAEAIDLTIAQIPGGWVIEVEYSDDKGYELREQRARQAARRIPASEF